MLLALLAASVPAASQPGPSLSAAPNPVNFGQTVVIKGKRWPVIGAGRWRVVARMRCESGKDGSVVPVRRSAPLRIR